MGYDKLNSINTLVAPTCGFDDLQKAQQEEINITWGGSDTTRVTNYKRKNYQKIED